MWHHMPETPLPEDKGLAQCPTTTPVSNRQFDLFLKKGPPQSANPTALSLTFKEVTVITEAMTECVPFSYVLIFLLLPTTD